MFYCLFVCARSGRKSSKMRPVSAQSAWKRLWRGCPGMTDMAERRRAMLSVCVAVLVLGPSSAERPLFGRVVHTALAQSSAPTFSRDIAPIVFSACAPCHRPDGGAPFPLITYEQVKERAVAIGRVTRERVMPPWKPEPGYGHFADERRLSDRQLAVIQAWIEAGAVEGDPALLPALPTWTGRWALGPPDLVLETPPYTLRSGDDDVYRTFVLPIAATKGRYVKAWQFLPGNSHVVHHATMQFDPTGAARE